MSARREGPPVGQARQLCEGMHGTAEAGYMLMALHTVEQWRHVLIYLLHP